MRAALSRSSGETILRENQRDRRALAPRAVDLDARSVRFRQAGGKRQTDAEPARLAGLRLRRRVDVERAMRKRSKGTLKSGRSGKKVTSRKQAIAIGLSEARKRGKKVPRKKRL